MVPKEFQFSNSNSNFYEFKEYITWKKTFYSKQELVKQFKQQKSGQQIIVTRKQKM